MLRGAPGQRVAAAESRPGHCEQGFPDLCHREVPDRLQVDMRKVGHLVGRDDAIDDRRPVDLELELGLAGEGVRRAFLVADADPFDVAAANRIGERIERVADQSEDVLDADLFERANQNACYRLRHPRLLAHRYQFLSSTWLAIAWRYFVV